MKSAIENKTSGIFVIGKYLLTLLTCLGCLVLGILVFHFSTTPLRIGDQFWQVRTGLEILNTGSIPHVDNFSYIISGVPWNNHQWGYELLSGLLYKYFGWGGFRWAQFAIFICIIGGILFFIGKQVGVEGAFLSVVMFVQLAHYKFNPAPQTVSMFLFLIAYYFFLNKPLFMFSLKKKVLFFIFLLFWGNLTAEVLIIIPFIILRQINVLPAENEKTNTLHNILITVLACSIPLLNPSDVSVLNYFIEGIRVNKSVNAEFANLFQPAATIPLWIKTDARILVVLFMIFSGWKILISTKRRETIHFLAPGLLCIAAAVLIERNIWMLIVPFIMMLLSAHEQFIKMNKKYIFKISALLIGAGLLAGYLLSISWTPNATVKAISKDSYYKINLDERTIPVLCVKYIKKNYSGKNVFTKRIWGNYVIWAAPDNLVFIDGRNREYPEEVTFAEHEIWKGGHYAQAILEKTGTSVVLAYPGWNRRNSLLMREWKSEFATPLCSVFTPKR